MHDSMSWRSGATAVGLIVDAWSLDLGYFARNLYALPDTSAVFVPHWTSGARKFYKV